MIHEALTSNGGELLTTAAAAKLVNRTPDTVRVWERTGKLPAIKTSSGQRLFRRADVEALADALEAAGAH